MNVSRDGQWRSKSLYCNGLKGKLKTMWSIAMGLAAAAMAPASVTVVNGLGADIRSVEMRNAARGTFAPAPFASASGGRSGWSFDNELCAYDLRVTLANGDVVNFAGVNPCDARLLTLKRNGATGWVDYD